MKYCYYFLIFDCLKHSELNNFHAIYYPTCSISSLKEDRLHHFFNRKIKEISATVTYRDTVQLRSQNFEIKFKFNRCRTFLLKFEHIKTLNFKNFTQLNDSKEVWARLENLYRQCERLASLGIIGAQWRPS